MNLFNFLLGFSRAAASVNTKELISNIYVEVKRCETLYETVGQFSSVRALWDMHLLVKFESARGVTWYITIFQSNGDEANDLQKVWKVVPLELFYCQSLHFNINVERGSENSLSKALGITRQGIDPGFTGPEFDPLLTVISGAGVRKQQDCDYFSFIDLKHSSKTYGFVWYNKTDCAWCTLGGILGLSTFPLDSWWCLCITRWARLISNFRWSQTIQDVFIDFSFFQCNVLELAEKLIRSSKDSVMLI